MVYADTSFWVSLYVEDVHSLAAERLFLENRLPIMWNGLGELELKCVLAGRFRGRLLSEEGREEILKRHARCLEGGFGIRLQQQDWGKVLAKACLLAEGPVLKLSGRSLDVLHVGIALEAKVTEFWTFDRDQAALAESQGIKVSGIVIKP